jgi:hypothetical protein
MQDDSVHKELKDLKDAVIPEGNGSGSVPEVFDPEKHLEGYLPVRVNEQSKQSASVPASCRLCWNCAGHSEDTHISPLGLLCLYVHRQSTWEPVLGADTTSVCRTSAALQVKLYLPDSCVCSFIFSIFKAVYAFCFQPIHVSRNQTMR